MDKKLKWGYTKLITWPMICSIVFIYDRTVTVKLIFMLMLIYGYLTFDLLPPAVTSVMVVFLGPMLHIENTVGITSVYFATAGLTMSTMFNAITLQYSGLHERITLWLILKLGCTPRKVMSGLMIVSMLLSMWFSNTFTANIMLPIGLKLYEYTIRHHKKIDFSKRISSGKSWINLGVDRVKKNDPTNLGTAYMYAIILGAISGGLNFARGSPTNITYLIIYTESVNCFLKTDIWFFYTLPVTIVITIFNCLWLQIAFLGLFNLKCFRSKDDMKEYENILKDEKPIETLYKEIGPVTWHEICVGLVMVVCVLLWVFRQPFGYPGWQRQITQHHIRDSTVTVFIAFLMIITPSHYRFLSSFSKYKNKRPRKLYYGLVTWLVYQNNLNWGEFFLIGCLNLLGILQYKYQLGVYLARKFIFMKNWPLPVVIIIVSFTVLWITEIVFNPVLSSMITLTLIDLAIVLNFHPMSISFISCLCISLSTLNPGGARSLKLVKTIINPDCRTLLKAGLIPKLISYVILVVMYLTFGKYTFYYKELQPGWIYSKDYCYCWPCGKNESLPDYEKPN